MSGDLSKINKFISMFPKQVLELSLNFSRRKSTKRKTFY